MADDNSYYTGSTYCGRCGREFPGGGVGNTFCGQCFADLRKENAFPEDDKKLSPEDPAKDLGSSGFRTIQNP